MANPASLIFTGSDEVRMGRESAPATHELGLQACYSLPLACPHSGHFTAGVLWCYRHQQTASPLRFVFQRRRNSNGLASKVARFSPDFCATRFLADLLMLWTSKSSRTTTTWFLLMSFETAM